MSGPAIQGAGNAKERRRWVIFRARRGLWVFHPDELLDNLPPALLSVALRRGKRWLRARRYALPAPFATADVLAATMRPGKPRGNRREGCSHGRR